MRGGSRHRFVGWSMADDDDDCVDFCLFWSHSAEYNDGVLGRLALRYLTIFNMAWTCCSRPCTRSPVKKIDCSIRQIWFVNLRCNIVHEASCWRDARMRPNIVWCIYIYSRAMGKVRLRHSCMKRLWCLYRGWNRSIGVWHNVSWSEEFLEKWTSVSRQLFTSLIYKGTIELISASYHLRGVVAELWYRSSSSCKLSIVNFRFWMLKQL